MVENNPLFVDTVLSEFLSDHTVVVTPTVEAGLAALDDSFDALLVDYDLDDGKGDEFVRRARATFAGRIVAISSHQRGNDALRAAGADACCSKMDFDRINELLLQRPA